MPYLHLKLSALPADELANQLAAALTDLTVDVLKKKRELTAVTVEQLSHERWFIGGEALANRSQQSFYLDIRVTAGTNTKDEKAEYIARVFAAMASRLGAVAAASYVVIHEVPAEGWGYEGQTQEFRYIKGRAM
ncbi:MAG: tautomerase family protein [Burkholderiaceae bacterium]